MIRKTQIALALVLAVASIAVLVEANRLVVATRVTADGDVLPSAWTYPSVFSAGALLIGGMVLSVALSATVPPTKWSIAATITLFLLSAVALWAIHRSVVWIQGVSHGRPGWW
jgi:hypothetical protein